MYFAAEFYSRSCLKVNWLPRMHLSSRLGIWLLEASPNKCPEVVLTKGVNMSEKTDHYMNGNIVIFQCVLQGFTPQPFTHHIGRRKPVRVL